MGRVGKGSEHVGEVEAQFFFRFMGGFVLGEAFGGAERVEKGVGDVAENGGAPRADAIFGDQGEKASEKLSDVGIGAEGGDFGRKASERVGFGFGEWKAARTSVELAEARAGFVDGIAAAAALSSDGSAEGARFGISWMYNLACHFCEVPFFLRLKLEGYPGVAATRRKEKVCAWTTLTRYKKEFEERGTEHGLLR